MTEDTIRPWLRQRARRPARPGGKGETVIMEKHGVIRRRWRLFGRVQGVGFRYRAKYAAQNLELTGWVENEMDGSVTMEAQGPADRLARLVPMILSGSSWIEIDDMQVREIPLQSSEHGFTVQGW